MNVTKKLFAKPPVDPYFRIQAGHRQDPLYLFRRGHQPKINAFRHGLAPGSGDNLHAHRIAERRTRHVDDQGLNSRMDRSVQLSGHAAGVSDVDLGGHGDHDRGQHSVGGMLIIAHDRTHPSGIVPGNGAESGVAGTRTWGRARGQAQAQVTTRAA